MKPEEHRSRGPLRLRPELWRALEEGPRLRRILEDFYRKVYADPRLMPFFQHTTIEWAIDHQYAFLGQIFSGRAMYFGDRPRNAHHWMVIDDDLFDYREQLMMETLVEHGLDAAQRAEWREVEEVFRHHIVKDAPRPRVRNGMQLPLDGYEKVELSAGGVCDGCGDELTVGSVADCHARTGRVLCSGCMAKASAPHAEGA